MNFRDLIFPISLAFIGTIALNYFFFPSERGTTVTDRRFVAPMNPQVAQPLDLDIDFYDAPPTRKKVLTTVQVPYGTFQFSNDGGIVDFIGYNRTLAGKPTLLEVIKPSGSKTHGMFLVGLDGLGKTPYYYELTNKKEEKGQTQITYKGSSPAASITKVITVHHDLYQIDIDLTIDPKESVRPRIFFPAPRLESDAESSINGVLMSGSRLEKMPIKDLQQLGIEEPSFFGLEDEYFAHVMFKDSDAFSQRAYYKLEGQNVQSILQSDFIDKKMSWKLSLYAGPKELSALSAVDTRLEGLLYSGWLAPLSKLLLRLLNYVYDLVKSYGFAILILALALQLMMFPFTSQMEQAPKKAEENRRKLEYIKQRYKDDPQGRAEAEAEFARKHMLPGTLGCLPLLIQFPIFLALRRVLHNAIELYHVPFLWIPNLAAPDPYYIIPLIITAAMALQMAQRGDVRQRLVNVMFALVIGAVTASLSAGLALFIGMGIVGNVALSSLRKMVRA